MSVSNQKINISRPQNHAILQKKLKIVKQANNYQRNQSSRGSKISLYSTTNSQIVNFIPARIDLHHIKRRNSNPYIHLNNDDLHCPETNLIEKQKLFGVNYFKNVQQFDQQYVLSPSKTTRASPILRVKSSKKCPTTSSVKQKIVIVSSSNCKLNNGENVKTKKQVKLLLPDLQVYEDKKVLKQKIKQKLTNNRQPFPQQLIKNSPNSSMKITSSKRQQKVVQKAKNQRSLNSSPLQQLKILRSTSGHVKKTKQIQKKDQNMAQKHIDMERWIQTDLQILKLFPKIDLNALVVKIKNEQKMRKNVSIEKWKQFDYCNISELNN